MTDDSIAHIALGRAEAASKNAHEVRNDLQEHVLEERDARAELDKRAVKLEWRADRTDEEMEEYRSAAVGQREATEKLTASVDRLHRRIGPAAKTLGENWREARPRTKAVWVAAIVALFQTPEVLKWAFGLAGQALSKLLH